jgi:hypothetical protein
VPFVGKQKLHQLPPTNRMEQVNCHSLDPKLACTMLPQSMSLTVVPSQQSWPKGQVRDRY